jgi:hypothetical protein
MRWAGVDVRYDVGWTDEVWLLRARWGLEVSKMLWYLSWHY